MNDPSSPQSPFEVPTIHTSSGNFEEYHHDDDAEFGEVDTSYCDFQEKVSLFCFLIAVHLYLLKQTYLDHKWRLDLSSSQGIQKPEASNFQRVVLTQCVSLNIALYARLIVHFR